MTYIHAIVLGIIEGLTEFLPISSTAHLSVVSTLLGLPNSSFVKSFEIAIQLGAFVAIAVFFIPRFFKRKIPFLKIMVAFIPTAILGFLLYKIIKTLLIGNLVVTACALIIGGVIILFTEKYYRTHKEEIENQKKSLSLKDSFFLGVCQSLAVIPGVSRSGAMIVGGMLRKYDRAQIAEFTFLVGAPTIFTASAYDLLKTGASFSHYEWNLLFVGFVVSGMVAFFVTKWFLNYIAKNSFTVFGLYRIYFGIALLIFALVK